MAWSGDVGRREPRPPLENAGVGRLWPFVLTVFFGIVFAGIADLSWLTAIKTTYPWFTSAVSASVYTSTLTTATLATLILASLAASKLAILESRARAAAVRNSDDRPAGTPVPAEPSQPVVVSPSRTSQTTGLDQILTELERFAEGPMVEVLDRQSGKPVPMSIPQPAQPTRAASQGRKMPTATREALRRARGLVWQTVAGPLAMFLLFISIAGAMLPGSGAFAQSHFQLNTGLILFLGYAWPFLVAWTVASIALLHILVRGESFERVPPTPMPRRERPRERSNRGEDAY